MGSANAQKPEPPGGIRPGQLGVVLLGRVIISDVAVTLVDLSTRRLLGVDGHDGEDTQWLFRSLHTRAPRYRLQTLLPYERMLLEGLFSDGTQAALSSLTPPRMAKVLKHTRAALVHDAVHRGWLRHLHHDQRTAAGEQLAARIRGFQRGLRHFAAEQGEDAVSDSLLPYAVRFGMMRDGARPLAKFARAWMDTFADLPGWHQPAPKHYNALEEPVPIDNSRRTDYGYTGP